MVFVLAVMVWLIIINVLAIGLFCYDKVCARRGYWRVPEAVLLRAAFLGGSPGAKLAQVGLRHKTRKEPFRTNLNTVIALQFMALTGGLALWAYLGGGLEWAVQVAARLTSVG